MTCPLSKPWSQISLFDLNSLTPLMASFLKSHFSFLLPFGSLFLSYLETLSPSSLVTPNVAIVRVHTCSHRTKLILFPQVHLYFLLWLLCSLSLPLSPSPPLTLSFPPSWNPYPNIQLPPRLECQVYHLSMSKAGLSTVFQKFPCHVFLSNHTA